MKSIKTIKKVAVRILAGIVAIVALAIGGAARPAYALYNDAVPIAGTADQEDRFAAAHRAVVEEQLAEKAEPVAIPETGVGRAEAVIIETTVLPQTGFGEEAVVDISGELQTVFACLAALPVLVFFALPKPRVARA